jgi:hypothetical protein
MKTDSWFYGLLRRHSNTENHEFESYEQCRGVMKHESKKNGKMMHSNQTSNVDCAQCRDAKYGNWK